MKKMILLVLLFALSIAIMGCNKDEDLVDEGVNNTLLGTEEFVVDDFSTYEYIHGEVVYIYKHIIGYSDDKQTKPIYVMVASKDVYDIGNTITVATFEFSSNKGKFNYRVIQLSEGVYDTSWHKYYVM